MPRKTSVMESSTNKKEQTAFVQRSPSLRVFLRTFRNFTDQHKNPYQFLLYLMDSDKK